MNFKRVERGRGNFTLETAINNLLIKNVQTFDRFPFSFFYFISFWIFTLTVFVNYWQWHIFEENIFRIWKPLKKKEIVIKSIQGTRNSSLNQSNVMIFLPLSMKHFAEDRDGLDRVFVVSFSYKTSYIDQIEYSEKLLRFNSVRNSLLSRIEMKFWAS